MEIRLQIPDSLTNPGRQVFCLLGRVAIFLQLFEESPKVQEFPQIFEIWSSVSKHEFHWERWCCCAEAGRELGSKTLHQRCHKEDIAGISSRHGVWCNGNGWFWLRLGSRWLQVVKESAEVGEVHSAFFILGQRITEERGKAGQIGTFSVLGLQTFEKGAEIRKVDFSFSFRIFPRSNCFGDNDWFSRGGLNGLGYILEVLEWSARGDGRITGGKVDCGLCVGCCCGSCSWGERDGGDEGKTQE